MTKRDDRMIFPNTYCYLKDSVCRFDHCISKGECSVCSFGLLRQYAARDSDHIGELMEKVEALEKANKKLKKELSDTKKQNKSFGEAISFYQTENETLRKGLAECCDRLWYYFGEIGDKWSNNQCKNVYDTAKYYLERAKKGEDDGSKY